MQVCNGATLMCSMGSSPSSLNVLPINKTITSHQPAANIIDHKPMLNIKPFGLCRSLANPVVAAATAANRGRLRPMPCIPATTSPWVAGAPSIILGHQPALNNTSKLMCNWAGIISIITPGQTSHIIS